MKKILMALAFTAIAYSSAEAQAKKPVGKGKETCSLSADNKFITCCKTTENPAYNLKGKTAVVAKKAPAKKATNLVARRPLKKTYYVDNYQVCKDEGGYYTCCLYENTTTAVEPR
jgi:hypothetical protein